MPVLVVFAVSDLAVSVVGLKTFVGIWFVFGDQLLVVQLLHQVIIHVDYIFVAKVFKVFILIACTHSKLILDKNLKLSG